MEKTEKETRPGRDMELGLGMVGSMLLMHPVNFSETLMVRLRRVSFIWADGGEFLPVLSVEGAGILDEVVPTLIDGKETLGCCGTYFLRCEEGEPERLTIADFYCDIEDIRADVRIDFRLPCMGAVAQSEMLGEGIAASESGSSVMRYTWDGVRPRKTECSVRPAALDADGWWLVLSHCLLRPSSYDLLSRSDLISAPLTLSGPSVEQPQSRFGLAGHALFPLSSEKDTLKWHPLLARRFSRSFNPADELPSLNPITILLPSFHSPQACLDSSLITVRRYCPDLDDITLTPLR